ncbi:GDSL-type esterase/lipase family protein [Amycolatopsis sp. FU40]|uniref:GDSL-type esterase/lipase family protein n=1 Tax=Amycolatopsis sp. FU40 TaxID=2914159 RepID=UPI001F1773DA|nr:GDSL-type esterase/lipase family protein [Amycolatopsis sp. FU40]UKD55575.1 GDSL-type esterase/lipase family protein [Amycolatopsis sp. FU40]
MQWITTEIGEEFVRGALELERTPRGLLPHRLTARARTQNTDSRLAMAETQPSGVRLAFRTESTAIELDSHRTKVGYVGVPPLPDGGYDLVLNGRPGGSATVSGGDELILDMMTGEGETRPGPPGTVRFSDLPSGVKDVEIWLPYNETTRLVALRTTAPISPLPPARRVWLHHGSSISHGTGAAGPSQTWPALAAAAAGVDLINLGFSGSALLDPFTARAIRDTPADLISVKLGINVVNADLMRLRAFGPAVHGFLDTIREGHPDVPLAVVSPWLCPIHEDTPGPGAPDFSTGTLRFKATGDPAAVAEGKLTLKVIREELARIVRDRKDPALSYVDGLSLYGEGDFAEHPLPDALHPDAATHRSAGERFAKQVFGPGGPFAG